MVAMALLGGCNGVFSACHAVLSGFKRAKWLLGCSQGVFSEFYAVVRQLWVVLTSVVSKVF